MGCEVWINKNYLGAIAEIIFWNTVLFQNKFDSLQVKWYLKYDAKFCLRVASQVAKQLKTQKTRKYYENINMGCKQSLVPSLPSKNKTLVTTAKN